MKFKSSLKSCDNTVKGCHISIKSVSKSRTWQNMIRNSKKIPSSMFSIQCGHCYGGKAQKDAVVAFRTTCQPLFGELGWWFLFLFIQFYLGSNCEEHCRNIKYEWLASDPPKFCKCCKQGAFIIRVVRLRDTHIKVQAFRTSFTTWAWQARWAFSQGAASPVYLRFLQTLRA